MKTHLRAGPGVDNSILPDQLSVEIPAALLEHVSSLKVAPKVDTLKGMQVFLSRNHEAIAYLEMTECSLLMVDGIQLFT